jgi:hypothetical protein
MAVGFDIGYVAGPSCGRLVITVPYAPLRGYMTAAARLLINDVRRPET